MNAPHPADAKRYKRAAGPRYRCRSSTRSKPGGGVVVVGVDGVAPSVSVLVAGFAPWLRCGRAGSTWLPYIPSPHEPDGVEPSGSGGADDQRPSREVPSDAGCVVGGARDLDRGVVEAEGAIELALRGA